MPVTGAGNLRRPAERAQLQRDPLPRPLRPIGCGGAEPHRSRFTPSAGLGGACAFGYRNNTRGEEGRRSLLLRLCITLLLLLSDHNAV